MAHLYEDLAATSGRAIYATRAVEEYKSALNSDPDSKFLQDGLPDFYLRMGRVKEATQAAEERIKANPKNIEAHKLLGQIYLRSLSNGDNSGPAGTVLQLAINEFKTLVTLEPKSSEHHLVLGQLYGVNKENDKAEEEYKLALEVDPNSENVVLNLARLYSEQGNIVKASKLLESIPLEKRTARMEFALAATYDELKDSKKAVEAYKRSLSMEPDNLDAERGLAQGLLNSGQLEDALKTYNEISQGDPQDVQTLVRISEIQRRRGKYEAALETLKKAEAISPDSLEIGFNKGLIADALGHYDEATKTFELMAEKTSHANNAYTEGEKNNRAIFLERLGAVYHEQNRTNDAIATYQKMIDLGDDYAKRGYAGQLDTYRDAHQYDDATRVARAAADAFPKDRAVKLMLASELADTGKLDEGISIASSLLDKKDTDREVYVAESQIYIRNRRFKKAEEALDKADALSKSIDDQQNIQFVRATLAERQKHYDQAEQLFRQLLEKDENNSLVLNYLGYMLADRGVKLTEALKLIRKAVEQDPQNGAYLDSLGWAYFKLGQYELAEENLRKAIDRSSTDPTLHDHLGEVYDKTGRIRQAVAQWEMSISQYDKALAVDYEPGDKLKVQKKLEGARVKLARQDARTGSDK
jgi:tetratricopeptide (TPR) repeat protein